MLFDGLMTILQAANELARPVGPRMQVGAELGVRGTARYAGQTKAIHSASRPVQPKGLSWSSRCGFSGIIDRPPPWENLAEMQDLSPDEVAVSHDRVLLIKGSLI